MAVMSDFDFDYELDNQVYYPVPPSVFEEVRYFIYKPYNEGYKLGHWDR